MRLLRTHRLRAAACVAVLAAVAYAAGPATAASTTGPVGGPALGSTGVVLDRLPGAPRLPSGLQASSWVLADLGTGQVLAARDAHGRFLPASTLKILTALVLIPRLPPTELVRASDADIEVGGTEVGIVPGMSYQVRTLFTAMLVVSANDAATALAGAAGGVPATLRLMNAEARYLNADDTHAVTPSGLDGPSESTSAYDLCLIARAALALPAFRHYISIRTAYMPAPHHRRFQMYTHDQLLVNYPGAIGVKNGYTVHAGGTFVGAATRHGRTLVVALLHGPPEVWTEAAALLTWGFTAEPHLRPVGVLVPPGPLPTPTHLARFVHHRVVAADRSTRSSVSRLPILLATLSALAVTWLLLRRRTRRLHAIR
jgi:D-alanyl-D-alanine carboxypeptidase (penicillin-binding protein 5/6)